MKIIDGKNAALGRLAGYAAKEALKGEEIAIVNAEQVLVTGNKKNIEKNFRERRNKIGSGQKGPKISRISEKIVKRAIRGMLPNHRKGSGKTAFHRIKCYKGLPKEFENTEKILLEKTGASKFIYVKEIKK